MGAVLPVMSDRRIVLTEARATANLTTATTLVLTADRRSAAVDMVALEEATVLERTMTGLPITPPAIVPDTNHRTSPRRTLIPLATPTPPVILIRLEGAMVEVVKRKASTRPLAATEEVTSLIAATNGAVMVAETTAAGVRAKDTVTKSTMTTTTRPSVLRS